MKTFLKEVLITVLLALIIYLVARVAIQTYAVFQDCMEPNFYEGQRVVINKAVYWFGDPKRGDVIIFTSPDGQQEDFIKRIIGIPGDTVEVKGGAVYINGVKLDEPYIMSPPTYAVAEKEIPPDSYFVLGDNRNIANDSRYGWYVEREQIRGKAWLITWPPSDWGVALNYPLDEQLADAGT